MKALFGETKVSPFFLYAKLVENDTMYVEVTENKFIQRKDDVYEIIK